MCGDKRVSTQPAGRGAVKALPSATDALRYKEYSSWQFILLAVYISP